MTNLEKVLASLKTSGPICDDCLSSRSTVKPRQTVNIICRELESAGSLRRRKEICPKCGKPKIINTAISNLMDSSGKEKILKTKDPFYAKNRPVTFARGRFSTDSITSVLASFSGQLGTGEIEIYNEFSLQHELGIYLRNSFKGKRIQFERNVSFFGFSKQQFVKREIDIVLYRKNEALLDAAIELKFPRNGQYPEQMYSFCKDVVFAEQLKYAGFDKAYVIIFAEDRLFYEGRQSGIYGFFRGGRNLTGTVEKPTGDQESELVVKGNYQIKWNNVVGPLKYTLIEAF